MHKWKFSRSFGLQNKLFSNVYLMYEMGILYKEAVIGGFGYW